MRPLEVAVVGRGKVGRTLAKALRGSGVATRLVAGRNPRILSGETVLLAIPDAAIGECAERLAARVAEGAGTPSCVLHTAGSLGPEALAPLSRVRVFVGQLHPLASFARAGRTRLSGVAALVQGDARAVSQARRICRAIGLSAVSGPVDPVAYHAAAALVSNGAVALVAAATELLVSAGLSADAAARALGALLATTGDNVRALGMPTALTGPVRRGDVVTVAAHRASIRALAPRLLALHRELVVLQLETARRFPTRDRASESALGLVEQLIDRTAARPKRGARR